MSDEEIVKLLIKTQERTAMQASEERKAQTDAFAQALGGLRMELRIMFVGAMLVLAGLSGLQATLKGWGIDTSVTPVSAQAQEHLNDAKPEQPDELVDPVLGDAQR